MSNKNNIDLLLSSWEETYKKGQLTLWIFISLIEGEKYVEEIKDFVISASLGTISCEEQSLYRALRKYEQIEVLTFELKKGNKGPDRKYYSLTKLGKELYYQFVERNIQLLFNPSIQYLLKK